MTDNHDIPTHATAQINDQSLETATMNSQLQEEDEDSQPQEARDKTAWDSQPPEPWDSPDWEERFSREGIERFYAAEGKTIHQNVYAVSKVGQRIMPGVIEPMTEAIEGFVIAALLGEATSAPIAAQCLALLDYRTVAIITTRYILNTLTKRLSFTALAMTLGRALEHELLLQNFSKQQKKLYETIVRDLTRRIQNARCRRHIIKQEADKWKIDTTVFDGPTCALVGAKLIELFIEATGLIEIFTYSRGKGANKRQYRVVYPSNRAMELIKNLNDQMAARLPVFGPINQKPKDWVYRKGHYEGGFHTLKQPFIRTHASHKQDLKGHRVTSHHVTGHRMPKVFKAVNVLQNTPYRINTAVLEVATSLWEKGLVLAGLPEKFDPNLHGLPTGFGPESISAYEKNQRIKSKTLEVHFLLKTAQAYKEESAFYFVHNVDFRGRVYPITSYLSPQGDDLNRGLLTFSDECGKPLGKEGITWLSIHTANCWGLDKVSFEERLTWARKQLPKILRIAQDPYADYWWTEADKPFQFLAVCFEWLKLMTLWKNYSCALPITVDGSNNALQHFSALLRDEDLGRATNMVPHVTPPITQSDNSQGGKPQSGESRSPSQPPEGPHDVYQDVCEALRVQLKQEATRGNKHARVWLKVLNRKLIKTPVMTYYYGVTFKGMEEQIEDSLKEQGLSLEVEKKRECIAYLVRRLKEIIPQKAPSVEGCMQLLKEVTRHLAYQGLPTSWVTPSGFKVVQDNHTSKNTTVSTKLFGKQRFWMHLKTDVTNNTITHDEVTRDRSNGEKASRDGITNDKTTSGGVSGDRATSSIDVRKQTNGISANFIHSLDAAALVLCVLDAQEQGVLHMRTIHDSFSVVPADMEVLNRSIRRTFKQMYQSNLLKGFLGQTLPPATARTLWEKSNIKMGTLNLDDLENAPYFFA